MESSYLGHCGPLCSAACFMGTRRLARWATWHVRQAANAFVLALLETVDVDVAAKTVAASGAAALWRVLIMPVDTVKTTFQVGA